MKPEIACPICKSSLLISRSESRCNNCSKSWRLREGIISFVDSDFYWGEIPREEMIEIIKVSEKEGYQKAIEKLIEKKDVNLSSRYIIGEDRADWRYLIPLSRESRILDLGSGWGTISFLLAKEVGHITTVEAVLERVKFICIRKEQDQLENITPIHANVLTFPFKDSSFDLIIMNGILEWVGVMNTEYPPQRAQEILLKRSYDLLAAGGYLYIGIENRFGYQFLRGAKDHSGLKYTSLMPRWMASLMVNLSTIKYRTECLTKGYRTYTYSKFGYKRMLHKVGFPQVDIYLTSNYNYPKYLIPSGNQKLYRCFIKTLEKRSLKRKVLCFLAQMLSYLNIQEILVPSYVIIAKK